MVDFINKFINGKYKNKLIILDNASSHRIQYNKKDNNLLYSVPYQHYTNAIEGYFNVLDEIPIHIYKNLIKGAYDRSEKYVKRP